MWVLRKKSDDKTCFYLLPGKEYQIGRKDCSILLLNDSSISRKHSVLKLESSCAILTDFSKYGTMVNSVKVKKQVKLNENDEIHFGQCQHLFTLVKEQLFVATSCINNRSTKLSIKENIKTLGGEIFNEWSEKCSHLLMESVTFTIKAVCCLANACWIVVPKFFDDLLKACEDPSISAPKPEEYFPEISERSLKGLENLFAPNLKRKKIFTDKKFLFLSSKQFKRLSSAIRMAGGLVELHQEISDLLLVDCCSDDVMVLVPEGKDEVTATKAEKDLVQTLMSQLHSSSLRPIKESEIGLAILHMSLDDYCNPRTVSDDSIAGTTSSQIIHDTEFSFQSFVPSKEVNNNKANSMTSNMPQNVLADDSQMNLNKKRKRSVETSMYITDTVPNDVTSPFHMPKKPNRRKSAGSGPGNKKEQDRDGQKMEVENEGGLSDRENVIDFIKETKAEKSFEKQPMDRDQEIDDVANRILEDDNEIFEDLFAMDTENRKESELAKKEARDRSSTDKSRVTETQLIGNDSAFETEFELETKATTERNIVEANSCSKKAAKSLVAESQGLETDAITFAVNRVSEKNLKSEGYEEYRIPDSQPTETIAYDSSQELVKKDHVKLDEISKSGETDGNYDEVLDDCNNDAIMTPLGFKNSTRGKPEPRIKSEIDAEEEPSAVVVVGFADLVVRKTRKKRVVYDSNVKNFKKFRKAHFPGKDRVIPRIIGGRDLVVYENANEAKEKMFAELNAINMEKDAENENIDAFFQMDFIHQRKKRLK